MSALVAAHVEFFEAQATGDVAAANTQLVHMTSLNLTQIILTVALVLSNVIMTLFYISGKLAPKNIYRGGSSSQLHTFNATVNNPGSTQKLNMRRFRFFEYMYSSPTAKLGVLLLIEELAQCFVTILIVSSTFILTRSYVHGLNISFTLFSTLFYYSTFVDICKAIEQSKGKGNQHPLPEAIIDVSPSPRNKCIDVGQVLPSPTSNNIAFDSPISAISNWRDASSGASGSCAESRTDQRIQTGHSAQYSQGSNNISSQKFTNENNRSMSHLFKKMAIGSFQPLPRPSLGTSSSWTPSVVNM